MPVVYEDVGGEVRHFRLKAEATCGFRFHVASRSGCGFRL